jgi:hypothetical protein
LAATIAVGFVVVVVGLNEKLLSGKEIESKEVSERHKVGMGVN